MNCYPSDWVSGAVPLVYAVNAILPPPPPVTHEEPGEDGTFTLKEREESIGAGQNRDLAGAFDRFIDAMGSMVGDEEATAGHHAASGDDATVSTIASESTGATDPLSYFAADKSASASAGTQPSGATVDEGGGAGAQTSSLGGHHLPAAMLSTMGRPALAFRGKSAPDLAPAPAGGSGITRSLSEESSGDEYGGSANRSSPRMSNFFRKRSLRGLAGGKSFSSSQHSQQQGGGEGGDSSAANLAGGQVDRRSSAASTASSSTSSPSPFQKARIVPVSKRHSFPPSKDPSGMNNPTLLAAQLRASSQQQMQRDRNFPSFYPHQPGAGALVSDGSSTGGVGTMPPFPPPPPIDAAVTLRGRSTSADYFFAHQGGDDGGGPQQQGILPAGWLEKHAHALPSVVLVVTVVDLALSPTQRVQQDDGVGEVVDNLRSSLATKRECRVHLVCIVVNHDKVALWEDDDKARQVEARQLANLRAKCRLAQSAASALHYPEDFGGVGGDTGGKDVLVGRSSIASRGSASSLTSSSKSTDALHALYRTVRQCSQAYYLAAARRAKKKLNALPNTTSTGNSGGGGNGGGGGGGAQNIVINNHHLLPLTIRYHFKVGVFYEFQGRIEKSLKYYEEAYRNVDAYYRFLVSHYAQIHRQQALLLGASGGGGGGGGQQHQQIQPSETGGEGHAHSATAAVSEHGGVVPRPPDVVGGGAGAAGESFGPYSTPARTQQPPVGGAVGDYPAVPQQQQQQPPPPPPTTVQSPAVGDSGVEVSLLSTPKHDSASSLPFAADDPESGTYRGGDGGPSTPPPREVRLTAPSNQPAQLAYTSTPEGASDLAHQCRGVADWLNFKILKASFAASSASNDHLGLVAAAAQWRRHAQVFLSPPASGEHELVYLQPSWHQWSYVAHQRLVISQIAERHPPPPMDRTLSATPGPFGEAMLHCSAWRQYEATAEAMLRLRGELRREAAAMESLEQRQREMLLQSTYHHAGGDHHQHRQKFVGGLDSEGLAPRFESEMTRDHAALALECIQRALSIFHNEYSDSRSDASPSTKGDDAGDEADGKSMAPSSFALPVERPRSSARLHYVAGNVLLTMGRYAEAMEHLECAASQVWFWSGLELAIGKALLRCIELTPSDADVGGRQSWEVAMFLLCRGDVSRRLSPHEFRRLRDVAFPGIAATDVTSSTLSSDVGHADGGDDRTMTWPMEFNSEAPFSFALTFPRSTNAVAGDVVQACLSLKSRLSFEVAVCSLDVFTSVGTTHVPMSLPNSPDEENEAHTTDQGRKNRLTKEPTVVNVSPDKVVFFKVPLVLPSESSAAVSLGGSKVGLGAGASPSGKSAATNASSLRTTKPKSSGFTRAGGACLLPIAKDEKTSQREVSSASIAAKKKGNIQLLATKQVICNGIRVGIIPLRDDTADRSVRPVQISLQAESFGSPKNKTKEGKSQSPSSRQSQEEGNYTFFAWARPVHHPFYLGPSCLRVQAPIAQLDVTDLTSRQTKGMAMDGTINRVVIRLKAGELEHCSDIKFNVVCSNSIPSIDTVSAKASNVAGSASSSGQEKNELPVRCAIMVVKDESMNTAFVTEQGVHIPLGWKLLGRDGLDSQDENCSVSTNLRPGQETLVHLDFFRPLSNEPIMSSSSRKELGGSYDGCQTDYEVVFTYRQKRQQPTQIRSADAESGGSHDNPVTSVGDLVSCRHHGVVRWCSPLEAHFSIKPGSQKTFPCGSRHPQNLLKALSSDHEKNSTRGDDGIPRGTTVIDGKPVLVRCTMESVEARRGLVAEVSKIRFKKHAGESGCDLDLIPAKSDSMPEQDDIIFTSAPGSDLLKHGGQLGLCYTVKASIKEKNKSTRQFALSPPINLGIISVEWMPVSLVLPPGLISVHDNNNLDKDWSHGPLALDAPLKIDFVGPLCQVESVPFEAALDAFPDSPHVAIPFDVKYCVKNKTGLHQKLAVSMTDTSSMQGSESAADGVLVSGLVNGDIFLAPYESMTLGYSALATKAGKTPLPSLTVASTRYQSWVINDGPKNPRHFFVLP